MSATVGIPEKRRAWLEKQRPHRASDARGRITEKIRERIGKLAGTSALIRVGAASTSEQENLKFRIEAAVSAARSALRDGVVPGGGAALYVELSGCLIGRRPMPVRNARFGVGGLAGMQFDHRAVLHLIPHALELLSGERVEKHPV